MSERCFQFSLRLFGLLFLVTAAIPIIKLFWSAHSARSDSKPSHLADDLYNQTYAKFTTKFNLFTDSSHKWRGTWISNQPQLGSNTQPRIMKNFLNKQGQSLVSFRYITAAKKTIMTIEILDDVYTDSSRLIFDFNLKMSNFDPRSSSFSINKLQYDEYSVDLQRKENITLLERINFFDTLFKAQFRHKNSKLPLNLDTQDPQDVLIDFTIRSNVLGLDFSGHIFELDTESYSYFTYLIVVLFLLIFSCSNCGTINAMLSTPRFIQNIGIETQILMLYAMLCYLKLIEVITQGQRNPFMSEVSFLFIPCGLQYIGEVIRVLRMFQCEMERLQHTGGAEHLYLVCISAIGYLGFLYLAFISERLVTSKDISKVLMLLHTFPMLQLFLTCFKAVNRNVYLFEYQGISWVFISIVAFVSKGAGSFYFNLKPSSTLALLAVLGWIFGNLMMYNQSIRGVYFFLPKSCLQSFVAKPLQRSAQNNSPADHIRCKLCEQNQVYAPGRNNAIRPADVRASCGHTYHRECLSAVLNNAYMCSDQQCRKTILPEDEGF